MKTYVNWRRIVKELSTNKAASVNIPVKLLKDKEFVFLHLVNCVNDTIINCEFPEISNTVPVYEKKDPADEENYRSVGISHLLLRVSERVLHVQLNKYIYKSVHLQQSFNLTWTF